MISSFNQPWKKQQLEYCIFAGSDDKGLDWALKKVATFVWAISIAALLVSQNDILLKRESYVLLNHLQIKAKIFEIGP